MSEQLLQILASHYKRSLGSPGLHKDKEKYPWASPNERLAQHIMVAYLTDLTGFGHENGLLDLFFGMRQIWLEPTRSRGSVKYLEMKNHQEILNYGENCGSCGNIGLKQ